MISLTSNWKLRKEESLSDHRAIAFNTDNNSNNVHELQYQRIRYTVKGDNYKQFMENFTVEARSKFNCNSKNIKEIDKELKDQVSREADSEHAVDKLQYALTTACRKTLKYNKSQNKIIKHKSVPWWTQELTKRSKKTIALRRRCQRTKADTTLRESRKQLYLHGKRRYETAIRQAKIQSWKEYCSVTTSSNPWNAVYRLTSGKIKKQQHAHHPEEIRWNLHQQP